MSNARPSYPAKRFRNSMLRFALAGSIGLASCTAIRPPLETAMPPSFSFVQLCDTQLGMGGYADDVARFRSAVRQINRIHPDFAIICGDLIHVADEQSFSDFNAIWANFEIPCYRAPGNHDVKNAPTPESLAYYRETIGKDYYAFEHKGRLFVIVNTQLWKAPLEIETATQDRWLAGTLADAQNKGLPVFIAGHYPLFINTPDEPEEYMNLPLERRRALLDLMTSHGVVAVLGGHTHRFLSNDYQGIQFVNGETTSKNFDGRPFGFRLWHIGPDRPFRHEFVPLDVLQSGSKYALNPTQWRRAMGLRSSRMDRVD